MALFQKPITTIINMKINFSIIKFKQYLLQLTQVNYLIIEVMEIRINCTPIFSHKPALKLLQLQYKLKKKKQMILAHIQKSYK